MKGTKQLFFHIEVIGCPMRSLEGARIANFMSVNGYQFTLSAAKADVIFLMACIVIKELENKSIESINKILAFRKKTIITGCYPYLLPQNFPDNPDLYFIPTKDLIRLDTLFPEFQKKFSVSNSSFELYNEDACNRRYDDIIINNKRHFFSFITSIISCSKLIHNTWLKSFFKGLKPKSGFLVISKGCNNKCTYCNIRESIGNLKSKPLPDIEKEYIQLIEEKYNYIRIIAEDLGSYGSDDGTSLDFLLSRLYQLNNRSKILWALDGVNPKWLVRYKATISEFCRNKTISEITIPFENGSQRILNLMKRQYDIENVKFILIELKKIHPALKINGIFIIGFPTETIEDINKTIDLLTDLKIDDVTLIPYSEFKNRESAGFFPKVETPEIFRRIDVIRTHLRKIKTPYIR